MIKRNIKRKNQSVPKQQVLAAYPMPHSAYLGQPTLTNRVIHKR